MDLDKGWKNLHWARVGEDSRQAAIRMIDLSRELFSEPTEKAKPPAKAPNIVFPEPENRLDDNGQFQLGLDF